MSSRESPKGGARQNYNRASGLYDIGLFIGRLCPPTEAHIEGIRATLSRSLKGLLLLGSADCARSPRVPFTVAERSAMIRGALTADENERLEIVGLPDSFNNQSWKSDVRAKVREAGLRAGHGKTASVAVFGHTKDDTSHYLRMFHPWESVELPNYGDNLSASDVVRRLLGFGEHAFDAARERVPDSVRDFLSAFEGSPDHAWLIAEAEWYRAQKARAEAAGYSHLPPIVTSEAVVTQSGHFLMCEILGRPGNGLLTLPGTTLRGRSFRDACIDTLVGDFGLMAAPTRPAEMTRRTVEGRIRGRHLFDHPSRSERGHVISEVSLLEFVDGDTLPSIGRGTSLLRPQWMAFEDIDPARVFEDRYHVIKRMVALSEDR